MKPDPRPTPAEADLLARTLLTRPENILDIYDILYEAGEVSCSFIDFLADGALFQTLLTTYNRTDEYLEELLEASDKLVEDYEAARPYLD